MLKRPKGSLTHPWSKRTGQYGYYYKYGYLIMVVVSCLSKYAHFFLLTTPIKTVHSFPSIRGSYVETIGNILENEHGLLSSNRWSNKSGI